MASIFSTLNTSRTGMTVHQSAINTTSHNIANSSTVGYSRQRVNIVTSRPISLGGEAGQIGTGAQLKAIERVRDSFLDYQVREENSELGKYSVKAEYLNQVEGIFNEPSDTGMSTLISDFFDSFQELSKQSTSSSTKVVVAQKTQALCDTINATYNKLEKLKADSQASIQSNVKEINSILDQITTLNNQIRIVSITGDAPNDLMDSRDVLIDELSTKFNITLDKTQFNGNDITAEELEGSALNPLVNSAPNGEVTRMAYIASIEGNKITYYVNGDTAQPKTIEVSGLTAEKIKELESSRVLLTNGSGDLIDSNGAVISDGQSAEDLLIFSPKSGEIAGTIEIQASIESYMNQLDVLAKSIAFSVNAVYSGSEGFNNNDLFFVNSSFKGDMKDYTEDYENSISAKNISINLEILNNPSLIKTGATDDSGEGDGSRALAIAKLQNTLLYVQGITSTSSRDDLCNFEAGSNMTLVNNSNGTKVESYFQDIIDKLGVESQHAQRVVANEEELLTSLELNRLSVSGVSLDEEMTNLIQYQHAYSANAKVISTVNEMLDVIINGLI